MSRAKPKSETKLNRYAVVLEYEGSAFAGWQYQDNAHTVQAALEAAIRTRFCEQRRVGGASRTDAGVHARGQVAAFDLAHPVPQVRLSAALNSALPSTVRVLSAKRVPAGWDPRKKSVSKSYSYLVYNRAIYSPLWAGRAWQVMPKLDLAAMRRAAKLLLGRHDFTSFRASGCEARDPVRTLKQLSVTRTGEAITIRATANSFLYHMVRNLAGTLVEVGKGRMAAADIPALLSARNRKLAGPTAPAQGLYLDKVRFR